jgi:hypothetical protein
MMKFKAATFPNATFFFLSKSNYLCEAPWVTEQTESFLVSPQMALRLVGCL